MTIYTRHGDKAETTTFDGDRVEKTAPTIAAYGDIDELTSHLGLLKALMPQATATPSLNHNTIAPEINYIEHLQRHLFAVGCCLMSNHPAEISFAQLTTEMEQRIDSLSATLPTLHTFVIPGNSVPEAQCHVCRTVCRRAERDVAAVAKERSINPQVLAFMNRLSDYLFVLARKLNFITCQEEKRWNKSCR